METDWFEEYERYVRCFSRHLENIEFLNGELNERRLEFLKANIGKHVTRISFVNLRSTKSIANEIKDFFQNAETIIFKLTPFDEPKAPIRYDFILNGLSKVKRLSISEFSSISLRQVQCPRLQIFELDVS